MTKYKPRTLDEVNDEFMKDQAFVARQQQLQATRAAHTAIAQQAEVPVIMALQSVGIKVGSILDLVGKKEAYGDAIPVLLEHVSKPYPETVLQSIARVLAVPVARQGWSVLLDEFRQRDEPQGTGVKWALGCALTGAADDSVIDDVIELVRDPRHGVNRVILLSALAKSNLPEAVTALKQATQDPELAPEATHLLTKVAKRLERQRQRQRRSPRM